ncbi:MAG: ABC transporter ATP-binding protein [Firmicutes bacterium]|nr:ABC transporter ATP-binding protein [Bacillota bacterium]NLL87893.1 ABC transporter ATP-binding protein [Bacillota bacterium]
MSYAVDVQNLSVSYESHIALEQITWQVEPGSLAAVIGPNGGGKSTLFKSLLRLVPPLSGSVRIFGEDPIKARPQVAYLPQREEVDWDFPIMCLDVVLQGRLIHRKWWQHPTRRDRELAMQSLQMTGMEPYASRPIGSLSGGQIQRVFIARALAQEARLIILDEPGAGLDAAAQHQLLDLFFELQRLGHTIVISTHDLNCLAAGFDTVLGLDRKVVLFGPPSEVLDGERLTKLFAKHFPVIGPEGEVSMHEL